VEVLIVISIALFLLAIAVPAIRSNDHVSSDVRRVVADITRSRSWARTTWRTTTTEIDVANSRWRIMDDEGDTLLNSGADENGWRYLNDGISFGSLNEVETDFIFGSDGRCPNVSTVILSGGDSTWSVTCSPLSGSVTAESFTE
jgi:Tfp pilus assembly protein FimT